MDSLTQIVLGAAMGEVAAGKKIGNRAMLWGAIAGTIPDLDVMVGSFMSRVDSLAFHRGITHSIFFAVVFSFVISKYTEWLYKNGHHKKRWYKLTATVAGILFMVFVAAILIFINNFLVGKVGVVAAAIICIGLLAFLSRKLIVDYLNQEQPDINLSWKAWYKLFFLAIFTHPLLDSFTAYGTQLFQPFSDYRVALNNISIADPIYTLPFLTLLILASIKTRNSPIRRRLNNIGIALSSFYMILTLINKLNINNVMENTLKKEGITHSRYMTAPTILNNVLWSGTVESDSVYYYGMYSMFDKERSFKLEPIKKNHSLITPRQDDKTINTLTWFANDYYSVIPLSDSIYQINDLRYGLRGGSSDNPDNYIFKFIVAKDGNGQYQLLQQKMPSREKGTDGMFKQLYDRLKGI